MTDPMFLALVALYLLVAVITYGAVCLLVDRDERNHR